MLEGNPDAVELRLDEPHKVYVKAPGYAPQLVVLEPRPGPDGELTLPAEDVCVELVPVGMGRNLELQVEE